MRMQGISNKIQRLVPALGLLPIPLIDEPQRRLHQQALLAEIGRRALSDTNLDTLLRRPLGFAP